jgi:hypothetical protein
VSHGSTLSHETAVRERERDALMIVFVCKDKIIFIDFDGWYLFFFFASLGLWKDFN